MILTTDWIDLQWVSDSGTGNGTATDFVLSEYPKTSINIMVSINGLKKTFGVDYTVNLSTKTVTFTTAPAVAQKINCTYLKLT